MAWKLGVTFSSVPLDIASDIGNPFTGSFIDPRDFYVTGRLFDVNGCVLTLGYFLEDKLVGFAYGFIDPIYKDYHIKMISFSKSIRGTLKFKAFHELRDMFDFMRARLGINSIWALSEHEKAFERLVPGSRTTDAKMIVYGGQDG